MPRGGTIFVLFPVFLLVGLLMSGLLLRLLGSMNSEYVITNQGAVIRSGAIIRDTRFIDLNKSRALVWAGGTRVHQWVPAYGCSDGICHRVKMNHPPST